MKQDSWRCAANIADRRELGADLTRKVLTAWAQALRYVEAIVYTHRTARTVPLRGAFDLSAVWSSLATFA